MKNIFGIDSKNDEIDGSEFIVRKISDELKDKQTSIGENLDDFENQARLPFWLFLIKLLAILLAVIFTVISVRLALENDIKYVLTNNRLSVVLAVCFWLIFFTIVIYGRIREKEVIEDGALGAELVKADSVINDSKNYLQIPEDAAEITLMAKAYKTKGEKIISEVPIADYVAIEPYVFIENDKIYLSDNCVVVQLCKDDIVKCEKIEKRLSFYGWTKRENYLSSTYRPYKITANAYGVFFLKGYLRVEIKGATENFELIVPSYDIENFLNVTNLTIE